MKNIQHSNIPTLHYFNTLRRHPVTEREAVLQLKNINKSFSGVQVLHDISFDLYEGEVHCLV